jgi:hypothetical protein
LLHYKGNYNNFYFIDLNFKLTPCSFVFSATNQLYFSLRTNQPPATSQQYFTLRTNQHQPPVKRTGCKLEQICPYFLKPISLGCIHFILDHVHAGTEPGSGGRVLALLLPPPAPHLHLAQISRRGFGGGGLEALSLARVLLCFRYCQVFASHMVFNRP